MDVKRRTVMGAAAILLMLVAAGCSSGDEAGGGAGAGPVAAPASFDVTLTEFAISPEMIHAPSGQDLAFSVTNDGTMPHTFAIDTGGELIETPELQPGETQALEVSALDAGEYQTLCTISGHAGLGMTGTLMVMAEGVVAAGASGTAGATGSHATMTVEEMLDGHREGVEAFPAETQGLGNRPLEPIIEGGDKVFRLTAEEVRWETKPGVFVDAMGFNGDRPRARDPCASGRSRADRCEQRDVTADYHASSWRHRSERHGRRPVHHPGPDPARRVLRLRVRRRGPARHVRVPLALQLDRAGRQGPVRRLHRRAEHGDWGSLYGERVDVESTLFLGDGPTGYVLNGKEFPATQPIVAEVGDGVLIHLANDGAMIHPMHLHGYHFEVIAEDGFVLAPGHGRHLDGRSRSAVRRVGGRRLSGRVGVPLSHPAARRRAAGDVRDGDGADRAVAATRAARPAPSCLRRDPMSPTPCRP
jgi:FtsP/CotA-like multicopper oxidase with cupredoxin domain